MLRDAACVDAAEPAGVYFGTRGGSVYASADEGEHFAEVASHLPDVLCVRAAAVSPPRSGAAAARRRSERLRPVAGISVVLPSVLQPLAGGQSFLTAPADTTVTVEGVLDVVTGEYPALSRRLRDETGAIRRYVNIYVNGNEIRRLQGLATEVSPGQEVLIIQSVAGG